MRGLVLATVVLAVGLAASGCVTHSAGVAPSTGPIAPGSYDAVGLTSGTSWGVHLVFLPLSLADTKAAVDDALRERGGDELINVTVDNTDYYLALFYLQRVRVQGMAVRVK